MKRNAKGLLTLVAGLFVLYLLRERVMIPAVLSTLAMLVEHMVIYRIARDQFVSVAAMFVFLFCTNNQTIPFIVSECIVVAVWMHVESQFYDTSFRRLRRFVDTLPMVGMLAIAAAHVYCVVPGVRKAVVYTIGISIEIGWYATLVSVAIVLLVTVINAAPAASRFALWALVRVLTLIPTEWIIRLDEYRQINHKSTQTDENPPEDQGENEFVQMLKRHLEFTKVRNVDKEMRNIMAIVEAKLGKKPEEVITKYMQQEPEKVNEVLFETLEKMMFENVGDSVQGLRNIAYVINVKGYETMAPRKLGLKILLETHPDKFRKKSKCVQKIYERIAKTATVLHNLA